MTTKTTTVRLLTNHGQVLAYVADNPETTMRQVADTLDLSERRVTGILAELRQAGLLRVERVGRRNRYTVRDRWLSFTPVHLGMAFDLLRGIGVDPSDAGRLGTGVIL